MILVRCACGAELGHFESMDDHSGVVIRCPQCNHAMEIHNQALCYPEEWGNPDGSITAGAVEPEDPADVVEAPGDEHEFGPEERYTPNEPVDDEFPPPSGLGESFTPEDVARGFEE